ncbi:CheR family methyltransferase [Actinoplanes sp. NPDC049668]|uniref:CheR family methyltransferase n=1 Tax=unclassified Actinoplanes TaxID=2626549 RepID=UPI0033A182C6
MTQPDLQFEQLLLYLKESRGFDCTGYKRSSLMRRVGRRMTQVSAPDYADYLDYLQVHPEELTALFNTILINVTSFFRDAEAWDYLRAEVMPALLAANETGVPLRVWSAGCASGEEAYSLAIMLSELLGIEEFRRRVKIYATDVDEEGLAVARHASYSERDVAGMPPELLERYFEASASRYVFRKDLRRSVIFGRNDLVQDAPISRIDLLVCRNALMYFNAETQSRILSRFHFALGRDGVLFLGKAEMLLSHAELFAPIDLKRRIFRKVLPPNATTGGYLSEMPPAPSRDALVGLDRLRGEAFTASPVAQVVVTSDGLVALSNRQAEAMFGVSTKDIGRPFRDLDLSYRPVELRGLIEQAQVERRMHRLTDVEFLRAKDDKVHLEVQINPLVNDANLLGVSLIFLDMTAAHRLQEDLEHANRQLETAYEELQSTNEELETTNEELQSTNEELETMNEELQSTNDELQTINDELRDRTGELDAANAFLEAVLTGMRAGVAVIDQDMRVQAWNRRAEDLWGLRHEEAVGQHFLSLDIGLPSDQLRPAIKLILSGEPHPQELTLPAVNRRGRAIDVRVVCSALARDNGSALGVLLVMDPTGDDGQPLTAP